MTTHDVLCMLLGAGLVAIGILAAALAAALADRLRARSPMVAYPRDPQRVTQVVPFSVPPSAVLPDKIDTPAVSRRRMGDGPRGSRPGRAPIEVDFSGADSRTKSMADDVIAALVTSGYKRQDAIEATWGCAKADRASVETWTAAALRRCAIGGMS